MLNQCIAENIIHNYGKIVLPYMNLDEYKTERLEKLQVTLCSTKDNVINIYSIPIDNFQKFLL